MAQRDSIKTQGQPCWIRGLEKAACEGDLESTLALRKVYLEGGCGLEADLEEALRYTELAACQGDPRSMYHTAVVCWSQGRFTMAARWMKKAYRAGIREASFGLARMYACGRGVDRDLEQAADYLAEAEEYDIEPEQRPQLQEYVELSLARDSWSRGEQEAAIIRLQQLNTIQAQLQLADWEPASRQQHLQAASDLGSPEAMYELSRLADEPKESFEQLKNAAKAGCVQAYAPLAACYRTGYGVSPNPEEAGRWQQAALHTRMDP